MMKEKIIIVGAGEQGAVIRSILSNNYGQKNIVGFLDDKFSGQNILGAVKDFKKYIDSCLFFVAIGNNEWRSEGMKLISDGGGSFVNAIHSRACIEAGAVIGQNVMVGANSYVNIGVKLEDGVFINNCCIVEHDNFIGEFSHLAPGTILGGGVKVGKNVFVGLGAIVKDHVSLGDNCVVGSGAVVVKDVFAKDVVAGVPAKSIKN